MHERKKLRGALRVAPRVAHRVLRVAAQTFRSGQLLIVPAKADLADHSEVGRLATVRRLSGSEVHPRFDLSRLGMTLVATIVMLVASPLLAADTFLGRADVWDIKCGAQRVAQLVPVQANRSVLITASYSNPQQFPFATFEFHATEANMRAVAHWVAITEAIRLQGIAGGCGSTDFTYVSDRNSFNTVASVLASRRPAGVSQAVDFASNENGLQFTHRDLGFAESRSQAVLVDAPDATRYDSGFAPRRVIGAVVFLLSPGHLLQSEVEKPYLYVWDGTAFQLEKELGYVTRGNVGSDSIKARVRGELGANLPVPSSLPVSTPSISPEANPNPAFGWMGAVDMGSPQAIWLVHEPTRFQGGGRNCVKFQTHAEMRHCFSIGSAILLSSPSAKQYDAGFRDYQVAGAIVYPKFDTRIAFIARWDSILEEYVDVGYSEKNGEDRLCRECLWSPQVQANIRRIITPNFAPIPEQNLESYTTAQQKYYLSHDEAAAILRGNPNTCRGIVPAVQPEKGLLDEDFDPPLTGFLCDFGDLRRVWKWVPETGASYQIAGAFVTSKVDERHAAALLRRYLGYRPTAGIELKSAMTDKAAATRSAAAADAADEAQQRVQAARMERIKRNLIRYGGGAALVITPLVLLVFLGRSAAASARRRRLAVVQDELNEAVVRESESARLLRLANEELREARARSKKAHEFRAKVQEEAKRVVREVKIDG